MNLSTHEARSAQTLIALALAEDFGAHGDVTGSATIPTDNVGSASFIARSAGVISGLPVAGLVCAAVDPRLQFQLQVEDGSSVPAKTTIATLSGPMRSLLAAERTALNFLQRLSGVATLTRKYVDAVGAQAKVLDTRKTTPGWRLLEKYAVRCGGGHNHRVGLYDGILIKDNHLAALGGGPAAIVTAVNVARKAQPDLPIEIEVDTVQQFEAALATRPEIIMLDNMSIDLMRQCVARRNATAPNVQLEASGGVNLETIAGIAATGVDRISVGALTHSAPALDIALDYQMGAIS